MPFRFCCPSCTDLPPLLSFGGFLCRRRDYGAPPPSHLPLIAHSSPPLQHSSFEAFLAQAPSVPWFTKYFSSLSALTSPASYVLVIASPYAESTVWGSQCIPFPGPGVFLLNTFFTAFGLAGRAALSGFSSLSSPIATFFELYEVVLELFSLPPPCGPFWVFVGPLVRPSFATCDIVSPSSA